MWTIFKRTHTSVLITSQKNYQVIIWTFPPPQGCLMKGEAYSPTSGRLEAFGSDSSSRSNFLVWSMVRNLKRELRRQQTWSEAETCGDELSLSHPLCRLLSRPSGLLTLVRLLNRAVGMMGTLLTGSTSTLTDGLMIDQLRVNVAASLCSQQATCPLTFSSWDRSRVCRLLTNCCNT